MPYVTGGAALVNGLNNLSMTVAGTTASFAPMSHSTLGWTAESQFQRTFLPTVTTTNLVAQSPRVILIRKDIARLNTVLREKIIGTVEAGTSASLPKASRDPRPARVRNA